MLLAFFSVDLNKCNNNPSENRITVVGTAIVMKNDAAVRTDENHLYYLDGIDDWGDKYRGKRVKVTGKLVIKKYDIEKITDSIITITPQQRLGIWRIIEKPKWSLVK